MIGRHPPHQARPDFASRRDGDRDDRPERLEARHQRRSKPPATQVAREVTGNPTATGTGGENEGDDRGRRFATSPHRSPPPQNRSPEQPAGDRDDDVPLSSIRTLDHLRDLSSDETNVPSTRGCHCGSCGPAEQRVDVELHARSDAGEA